MLLLIYCKKKLSDKKSKPAIHANGAIYHEEEKSLGEEKESLKNNGNLIEIDEKIVFVSAFY